MGHTTELYNVPYSLSEDFVSSYRMHPLIPDEFDIDGDKVMYSHTRTALWSRWQVQDATDLD